MTTAYEEVLELVREVTEMQKENARRFEETGRMFRESDRKLAESDRKFQQALQQSLAQSLAQSEQRSRQLEQSHQETERLVRELSRTFGSWHNRLGEFVEEMVRPAVLRLFRSRGLDVHYVMRDLAAIDTEGGEGIEIDLMVANTSIAVGVECKSRLTLEDVREHLERLAKFKRLFPEFANHRLLGAVAAMVLPDAVARFAYRQGLFVLAQNGDSIEIRNDERFQPQEW